MSGRRYVFATGLFFSFAYLGLSGTSAHAALVDLKANGSDAPTVTPGTSIVLSWTTTQVSSCTASGDWSGTKSTSGSQSMGSITTAKTYKLLCRSAGTFFSDTVQVSVSSAPAPTVTLKANNLTNSVFFPYNTPVTLSWTSANATSCTASNAWSGTRPVNGTEFTGNLTATTTKTYILTCIGAGGSAYSLVNVAANAAPASTVDLKANNTSYSISIPYNTSAVLKWTSTNATSCTASNGWSGAKAIIGSESTSNLTATKTYTLSCSSGSQSTLSSVTVNVAPASTPVVDIKANNSDGPLTIASGSTVILSWTSTNATLCNASNGFTGAKAINGTESTGKLTVSKIYVLTCTGAGGSVSDSVTVTVNSSAPTLILKANNSIVSTTVAHNTAATLSWPTTDASSCWASGDWYGWKTIGGSESTGNLTVSKTYRLQCWAASGVATPMSSITVNITSALTPTVDIKANTNNGPLSIASGTVATLSWTSTNATSCTASNGWSGAKTVSGTLSTGALTASKIYTITCTGTGGSVADSVTVAVNSSANDKPSAVAKIGVNGSPFSSSVTVIKGVPVTLTLDASASSDPDGWTTIGTGVSQGGKCEWNTDLNAGTPTFEKVISNPASPAACTTSLGMITFNDHPGTHPYNALRITDAAGAVSTVATIHVTVVNPVGSQAPVAVAKFIVNGGAPSSNITVTRGVPVTLTLDASASSDPDGWTTIGTGVSQGGKCEWNTTLDQSKPASFRQTIINPVTSAACNINLGTLTFNDAPGKYSYTLLRITDASGSKSLANVVDAKSNGLVAKLFPWISAANAAFAAASVSVTVVE